jgi:hypothetical protein
MDRVITEWMTFSLLGGTPQCVPIRCSQNLPAHPISLLSEHVILVFTSIVLHVVQNFCSKKNCRNNVAATFYVGHLLTHPKTVNGLSFFVDSTCRPRCKLCTKSGHVSSIIINLKFPLTLYMDIKACKEMEVPQSSQYLFVSILIFVIV